MSEKIFDPLESAKAQAQYCEDTGAPHFAPKSGVCWNCYKNIYQELPHRHHTTIMCGISVEQAKNQLVTGCPHCNRSYCD